MRTAISSGGAGDILYSVNILKLLYVDTLLIKESFYAAGEGSLYTTCKRIMELQGFKILPTPDEGKGFSKFHESAVYDIDMDDWRAGPRAMMRGKEHIMLSMMLHWRVFNRNWKLPWLSGIKTGNLGYSLVYLTRRWRDRSPIQWASLYRKIPKPVYFIGHKEDHEHFCSEYGQIGHWITEDLLDMAGVIANCAVLYCNQGVALVIAQGLGKTYWLEQKPGKTNTLLDTVNENILE